MQMRQSFIEDLSLGEIDLLRREYRIPVTALCAKADVSPSTYHRWMQFVRCQKDGKGPQRRSLQALRAALRSELDRYADGLAAQRAVA